MKKILAMLLTLCLLFALCTNPAWAVNDGGEKTVELIVFAASSLTETLMELKVIYEAANPGVRVIYNFDSSGTLKTQIIEGADCDIFISASQKQMNQLDSNASMGGNEDSLNYILEDTCCNILENKVVLAVPEGNPAGIASFDDLATCLAEGMVFMVMGNSDVPVGQYTQSILAYYGLQEEELAAAGVLTYGSNAKEVTTQISAASVDCGVVYGTDALAAGIEVIDCATVEMCGQVIYPAAVLSSSANEAAARAFLRFLQTDEAMAVFEAVGFNRVAADADLLQKKSAEGADVT